jgi:GrpB-like predicted nucleotidyltransferase (UPF0157 family)
MAADSLRAQPDQQHERTGRSRPGLGHGLKQELAAAHPDNGSAYTAGKRELVARILATAGIQLGPPRR